MKQERFSENQGKKCPKCKQVNMRRSQSSKNLQDRGKEKRKIMNSILANQN